MSACPFQRGDYVRFVDGDRTPHVWRVHEVGGEYGVAWGGPTNIWPLMLAHPWSPRDKHAGHRMRSDQVELVVGP